MRIEIRFTQSWEVFTAAQNATVLQALQQFARVDDRLVGIVRNCPGGENTFRRFEFEIEYRRKIDVEAESAAFLGENSAVLAVELLPSRPDHICNRWRRCDQVTQPIHRAALEIDAQISDGPHQLSGFAYKVVGLLCLFNVAAEQNHAPGLQGGNGSSQTRRHF